MLTYEYVPNVYGEPFGWYIFVDGNRTRLMFYRASDAAAYCAHFNHTRKEVGMIMFTVRTRNEAAHYLRAWRMAGLKPVIVRNGLEWTVGDLRMFA